MNFKKRLVIYHIITNLFLIKWMNKLLSRSASEMVLSTADGKNGFEWWFTLVPE